MCDECGKLKAENARLSAALVEERAIALYKATPKKSHDHLHRLPEHLQEDWRKKARKELGL